MSFIHPRTLLRKCIYLLLSLPLSVTAPPSAFQAHITSEQYSWVILSNVPRFRFVCCFLVIELKLWNEVSPVHWITGFLIPVCQLISILLVILTLISWLRWFAHCTVPVFPLYLISWGQYLETVRTVAPHACQFQWALSLAVIWGTRVLSIF